MDIFETSPIILSFFLVVVLQVKKGYWLEKIKKQLERYDLSVDKLNNIIDIVEDVYTSISFVGAVIAILFGVILIIIKESFVSKNLPFLSIDFCILVSLMVVYIVSLHKIFSMKTKLLTRKIHIFFLSRLISYCELLIALLLIGYAGTLYVIISS